MKKAKALTPQPTPQMLHKTLLKQVTEQKSAKSLASGNPDQAFLTGNKVSNLSADSGRSKELKQAKRLIRLFAIAEEIDKWCVQESTSFSDSDYASSIYYSSSTTDSEDDKSSDDENSRDEISHEGSHEISPHF